MSTLLGFLLKANRNFFIIILVFTFFAIEFGGIWKIVPYILLVFFYYDWNVSSKLNKTWLFIETLPISLLKKYFLRVVFPFIFGFSILFCLEAFQKNSSIIHSKAFFDALRQSCIFVLSSVLAYGLGGYILWMILFHLILFSLSFFNLYLVCFLIIVFSYSYYVLSRGRLSKSKFVYFPLFISLILITTGNFFQKAIYKMALSIPIKPFQVYAAQMLVDEWSYLQPQSNFSFHIFQNQKPYVQLHEKEESLVYDDGLVGKVESILVQGPTCSHFCKELADVVQDFPEEWNEERLLSYLNSQEESKQIYVLRILRNSKKTLFLNRIMQLTQSENLEVSNLAQLILNNWGIPSIYDIPKTQVF